MSTTTKLCKDTYGENVEQKLYNNMVGSLLYLIVSLYQANPKEYHLKSVKQIIWYVNGTLDYGLWYHFDFSIVIIGYSDANWIDNIKDKRSISSVCFFFCPYNCIVGWLSSMKNLMFLSTTKLEYIAIGSCCSQLLWMKQMLNIMAWSKTLWASCVITRVL